MEELNKVEAGKKMLWVRSWPNGKIEDVEVIEKNDQIGKDCWYIRRGPGSTDTTHEDFLFDYPDIVQSKKDKDANFIAGLGYACSLLVYLHDKSGIAKDIIKESGFKKEDFKKYCDEYDFEIIKYYF